MRMPNPRQSLILIAGCGGAVLLAILAGAALGGLPLPDAAGLALTTGCLGGILVLGMWTRRLDGKVQRLDGRVQRLGERPAHAPSAQVAGPTALDQRMERVEAAIQRLSATAERLEERTGTVLATLGEDRVEAVYRTRQYSALLTEMAADLRDAAERNRHEADEPTRQFEERP
jgi:hypothetical protein